LPFSYAFAQNFNQQTMNRIITTAILLITAAAGAVYLQCCNALAAGLTVSDGGMLPEISDYHLFTGNPVMLQPATGMYEYEPATGLFTDYAEKQRLIKLPEAYKLTAINDGLPYFPDGTMFVKTFYYWNDKRDTAKGKQLIETRLLIKTNGQWNGGTYVWNKDQTEALLVTNGTKTSVAWIDKDARQKTITYRIPSVKDCGSCHNTGNSLLPIGFKIRNLNVDVVRNKEAINQLSYLQRTGVMNAVDPSRFAKLPVWQNANLPVEERARAYLDVNCAHCHSDQGSCAQSTLRFAYDIPFANTHIADKKNRIVNMMAKGRMPRTGTTIVDEEALALIKSYIQNIK
jgi:uncharacterized repeat protein (TIGR03806 family)